MCDDHSPTKGASAPRPVEEQPRVGFVPARDERSIFLRSLDRVREAMKQLARKEDEQR